MVSIRQLKDRVRYALASYPEVFIPFYRVIASKRSRALLVSDATDIVIEGFPRSGNTFAVVAFLFAQHKNVVVAHHLHVEAQILDGVKRRIPVLVLLRNPYDAIRSLLVRDPDMDPVLALRWYIRFYTICEKVREHIVVGHFEDVTSNFEQVMRRVNQRYNKKFYIFIHNEENVRKVFAKIKQINQHLDGNEMGISRPSRIRQKAYSQLRLELPPHLLHDAMIVYERLKDWTG